MIADSYTFYKENILGDGIMGESAVELFYQKH